MAGHNFVEEATQLVKQLFVEEVDIYRNPDGLDEPNFAGLPMSMLLKSGYTLIGTADYKINLFTGKKTLVPESVMEIEEVAANVPPA